VRVRDHACSTWGVGKVLEVGDTEATISWFDSPVTDSQIKRISRQKLDSVVLERQTRVYWLDRKSDTWRVGRILDADDLCAEVRFPNSKDLVLPLSELEVRWDHA